jgi:peptidyl-prolyl cis-trans isomerase D
MLQKLTDTIATHKWFWYTILGALALVFAAWGAYGIVNLNFGSSSDAATVNGVPITLQQAQNAWLREQGQIDKAYGGNLPSSLRKHLQNEVLEELIRESLVAQRTEQLGYRVSEADLIAAIRAVPSFQVNGHYSAEAAKDVLTEAGVSLTQFEHELESQLRSNQLFDGIRASDFLTPVEIQRAQALNDQQREVQYLQFPASRYTSHAPVSAAQIQAYYQAHQAAYLIPQSVDLRYAQLTLRQVRRGERVSDAALQDLYQKEINRFVVPERREASHILITFGKDPKAALAKAEHILKLARSGANFAALAKQYSQDPGSARKGGNLGWIGQHGFIKPFTQALFAIPKVGDIVGPVKSPYGYHIIRLDAIQPGHTRPFAKVKAQLTAQLKRSRATRRFGRIEDRLQNALNEPGVNFGALVKHYGLTAGQIPLFLRGTGAAPLGAAPAVQSLVFGSAAMALGAIGGPVILDNDRMVIVKVLARHGPQVKPLAEVQASIVKAIEAQRAAQGALAAAEAARQRLAAGQSFAQVGAALHMKVAPARFIGRDDPSVPASILQLAFAAAKPVGHPIYEAKPLTGGAGAVLLALSAVRIAPNQNPLTTRTRLQEQLRSDADGDVVAYMAQMRATAKVRKNPNAFQ